MGANVAKQFGEMIGDMAHDMHVAGWYAPAMNIHRGAFSSRTFEYFSEDSLLSGVMASNESRCQGEGRVLLHEALRSERSGNQPYQHGVHLGGRAGHPRDLPQAVRDEREGRRRTGCDELLQLHRLHLCRCLQQPAEHRAP